MDNSRTRLKTNGIIAEQNLNLNSIQVAKPLEKEASIL